MTAVRTHVAPRRYASTSQQVPMLMLDPYGQINVIYYDDMDGLFTALNISPEKKIRFSDLINANLVYSLAELFGLKPGLFKDGDNAIIETLRRAISDDVVEEDKDRVIAELITSWRLVCDHPLAKKYIPLGEHLCLDNGNPQLIFKGFGGYALFIHDHYCGLVKLLVHTDLNFFPLFISFTECLFSSLQGEPCHSNYFSKKDRTIEKLGVILPETGTDVERVKKLHAVCTDFFRKEKGEWIVWVMQWVKMELENIEETNVLLHGPALTCLLENSTPISPDPEIALGLAELAKYLSDAVLDESLAVSFQYKRGTFTTQGESDAIKGAVECSLSHTPPIKEAIRLVIMDFAKANRIPLFRKPALRELPAFCWAGRSEADENRLIEFLLVENNRFALKPFECYAIAQRSKNVILQELIAGIIANRGRWDTDALIITRFSALSISPYSVLMAQSALPPLAGRPPTPPPFMPQYRRLEQSLRGNSVPRLGFASASASAAASSTVVVDDQPPTDVLNETFELRQESAGCAVM